jgi:hypothetical protein
MNKIDIEEKETPARRAESGQNSSANMFLLLGLRLDFYFVLRHHVDARKVARFLS